MFSLFESESINRIRIMIEENINEFYKNLKKNSDPEEYQRKCLMNIWKECNNYFRLNKKKDLNKVKSPDLMIEREKPDFVLSGGG